MSEETCTWCNGTGYDKDEEVCAGCFGEGYLYSSEGLLSVTMRAEFVRAAMQGLLASSGLGISPDALADFAVTLADTTLAKMMEKEQDDG